MPVGQKESPLNKPPPPLKEILPRQPGEGKFCIPVEVFRGYLEGKIIGQESAIKAVTEVYEIYRAGICPLGRPIGSFLFLGPSGSGKTRTAEAVTECLTGSSENLIVINCGEFQEKHEVAKLIGAPPGYLGHKETRPFITQAALDACHTEERKISFVLLDEIEKASISLPFLLFSILDKAKLRLGDNSSVDFSRTMIFMTSNVGTQEISSILEPRFGFKTNKQTATKSGEIKRIEKSAISALGKKFDAALLNRIDRIQVFRPLSTEELEQILKIEIDLLLKPVIATGINLSLEIAPTAKNYILNAGTSKKYGARELKRVLAKSLLLETARLITKNNNTTPGSISFILKVGIDKKTGNLKFETKKPV